MQFAQIMRDQLAGSGIPPSSGHVVHDYLWRWLRLGRHGPLRRPFVSDQLADPP